MADIVIQQPDDSQFKNEAAAMVKTAQELTIKNQHDYDYATELLVQYKSAGKRVWDALNDPCKKIMAALDSARNIRDIGFNPFKVSEGMIKTKMEDHVAKIERKRMEEQAKADEKARQKAAAERQAQIEEAKKRKDKEALENLKKAPLEVAPAIIKTPEVVQGKGVSMRKVWKVANVDRALLPQKYLMPDIKAIEATVKGLGALHGIPGVSVVEETITSARA